MSKLSEQLAKLCTLRLMANDCETIKAMVSKHHDSIFSMCFIPYMALFFRSVQEYFDIPLINPKFDDEIYDIRNSIKQYSDRYGKSKQHIIESDEIQDKEFRDLIRFDFIKETNLYYNLGIFFDDKHHPIGNTQFLSDALNMNDLSDEEKKEKAFLQGYYLSSAVKNVSNALSKYISTNPIQIEDYLPAFCYSDQNTNANGFFNYQYSKDINLFHLHLLCNIGFIKYVLEPIISFTNPWVLRIKYLVAHYTLQGLKRLKAHIENNYPDQHVAYLQRIDEIIKQSDCLFSSKFRNCMMHYSLEKNGQFIISENYYDENKILFGLVEECFNDKTYSQYFEEISFSMNQTEELLASQFDFHKVIIKQF